MLSYLELFFLLLYFTAPGHNSPKRWTLVWIFAHMIQPLLQNITCDTLRLFGKPALDNRVVSFRSLKWGKQEKVDRKECVKRTCPYSILQFMWEKTLWMCSKHFWAFCLPMPNAIKRSPQAINKRNIHRYLPTLWNHHILRASRADLCRFSIANVCTPGLIEFVFVLPVHTVDYLTSYKPPTMLTNKVPKGASGWGHG